MPGEHRGLTLICWVKINSLDRWYNSLFLTDGHEDREPHWQIMDDGRIFFSVKLPADHNANSASPQQHVYYSPKVWDGSLSGRWIMLCVTYDVDRKPCDTLPQWKTAQQRSDSRGCFGRIHANWPGVDLQLERADVSHRPEVRAAQPEWKHGRILPCIPVHYQLTKSCNLYRVGNPNDL